MRILVPEGGCEWDKYLHLPRSALFSEVEAEDFFDLAVILPEEKRGAQSFRCGTLLLWEGTGEEWLRAVTAEQVISCGFASQNTLTPASTEPGRSVMTVQRELKRPDGNYIWPQDVPLPEAWAALPMPQQMMLAGLWLLGAGE